MLLDQYYSHPSLDNSQVSGDSVKNDFVNSSNQRIERSKVSLLDQTSGGLNSNTSIQVLKDLPNKNREKLDNEYVLAKFNNILDPESYSVVSKMLENPKLKSIIDHVISSNLSKEEIIALLSKYRNLTFPDENEEFDFANSNSLVSKSNESEMVLHNENPYRELQENPQGLLRRLGASSSVLTPDNPYYDLANRQANSK